jgi:alpha-glucosidase (family GH31 glycosyl hydrolase)
LDWFNPDAKDTWATGLFHLMETIQFDGLWLSENAPSIMCEGGHPECDDDIPPAARADKRRQLRENVKDSDDDIITDWYTSYGAADEANSSTYHLPFIPQTFNLDVGTISLNVTHGLQNADNTTMKEYDVHGLFGHMQSKVTYEILNDQKSNSGNNRYAGLRKFISSTSTFAGTGKYAQHHLQPQLRTWDAQRYSISGIMNFNMFGIPFTGADVCAAH